MFRAPGAQGASIELGDAAAARPGHFVVAIARGTDGSLSASAGIIARTGGAWRSWRGGSVDRLIQLDGGLWAGFSGGPVVDARGGVLGIGTSALSRGRAVVIPGSVLKRVSAQLLARGHVSHAYIGAAVQPVDVPEALRTQLGISHPTASSSSRPCRRVQPTLQVSHSAIRCSRSTANPWRTSTTSSRRSEPIASVSRCRCHSFARSNS